MYSTWHSVLLYSAADEETPAFPARSWEGTVKRRRWKRSNRKPNTGSLTLFPASRSNGRGRRARRRRRITNGLALSLSLSLSPSSVFLPPFLISPETAFPFPTLSLSLPVPPSRLSPASVYSTRPEVVPCHALNALLYFARPISTKK